MISRILLCLGALAVPGAALAHPGHVANLGHGHAHWIAYMIGVGALLGLAIWFGAKLFTSRKSTIAKRT